jgi:hypothetical protein
VSWSLTPSFGKYGWEFEAKKLPEPGISPASNDGNAIVVGMCGSYFVLMVGNTTDS